MKSPFLCESHTERCRANFLVLRRVVRRTNHNRLKSNHVFGNNPMNPTERKIENARTNTKIAVSLSDMSASEISLKAGMSVNVLGKYMRGETMISFGNMISVCEVLGVPIALITSDHQITPARIRLHRLVERMTERDISDFLESEKGRT